jgi:hypothetical protein
MKFLSLAFFLFIVPLSVFTSPVHGAREGNGEGCFITTGHIYMPWKERSDIGADQNFIEKGIPFINGIRPDFLVLTGDIIYHPKKMVKEQLEFVIQNVFNKIETKIYSLAGNHDTGWLPYPPAIELFEKLINPLHFSFVYKGSLFLFLSLYQPFPHVEGEGIKFPLKRVWDTFDTPASRSFLDNLREELKGQYDHIFIFVHIPPISDHPIGYHWSHFLIPLLSSSKQDVYIFSTCQATKKGLLSHQAVRYKNLCFYCWASFPIGSYIVHFDESKVRVDLMQGDDFVPAIIQEVDFQPTTRWSMLCCYLRQLKQDIQVRLQYWLRSLQGKNVKEHQLRRSDPNCLRCKPRFP